MAKRRKNSDSRIASLKMQNDEYNKLYRNWRIEHKNDFGFYFAGETDILTYRDGEGFDREYPEADERGALEETVSAVGKTLLIYTCLNFLSYILFYDFHIGGRVLDYVRGGTFVGSETQALAMSYIVNIVSRILPLFYLLYKTRIPLKLALPVTIGNKPMFMEAVPMALFVSGLVTLISGFRYAEYSLVGINVESEVWQPEGKVHMALSVLLNVVILPVLSEAVHRGIFMQVLRQFGDGFALIMTSLIAALTAPDIFSCMYTLAYSLLIGFFVMRTGSLLTAFVMRIIISVGSYWMKYIKSSGNIKADYLLMSMIMMFVCLTIGTVSLVRFIKKHSNSINLPFFGMFVSNREKIMCVLTRPSVIIWFAATVLTAFVSFVL